MFTGKPEESINLHDAIKAAYSAHRQRGVSYFDENRVNLIEKLLNEDLTENDLFVIEEKIHKGISMIQVGDWKTALHEMENNVVVGGAYTQAMHDAYVLDIQTYITEEY